MANSKLGTDQTSATRPFQPWILSTICLSATAILAACSFFTDDKDLVLVASVKYSPMRWLDAQYGPAKAFGFKIASSAQVVLGNAGNQYATLSWVTPDGKKGMCRYKGGSSQAKPTSKKELEKAQYYNLDNCSDNLKANDVVSARMLSFHIDNGGNPGKGQETAAAIKVGITSAPAPTPTPTKTPTVKPEPSPVPTASPSPAPTPVWQSQGWGGAGAAPVSLPGATAINPQVGTHLGSSVAFLYQGANPIQKDVNPGSIDVLLAGVVRGIVKDGNGAALAGVKVSALGRPDLGYTLSRADGGYDFVVNGGENYTLDYSKTGSFAAQRVVRPEVNNFVFSADVMLVAQSAVVTKITSSTSNFQIARGEAVTDKDGTRQINLLVPPATTFEAVKADGSRVSFDSASIRITEFTVGANGPARMPATLPANSGYTFAAEFSADEGSGVAAQSVEFSQPMPVYLDNFLSYPLGTLVPSGYYDRQRGEWVPSEDGVVAKVLSVTNGLAQITWHSDGTPLSSAEKDLAGVTDAELRSVAGLYAPGKLLWRMRISHFTPWDFNQPVYVRDTPERQPGNAYNGCRSGSGGKCEPEGQPDSKPNCQSGSIIECENQTAREQVEIAGTGVQLTYSSAEQLGYTKPYTARIPITGPSGVPSDAKEVRATITIAGRQFVQTFTNLGPNYSILFTWDGLDAYGRRLDGTFSLKAEVSFYYNVVTLMGQLCVPNTNDPLCTIQVGRVASFAQAPGSQVSPSDSSRATLPFTKTHVYKIGVSRAGVESASLGGWRLSAHNSYDLGKGELIRGDGTRLGSEGLSVKTKTLFAAPFTTCTPLADFQDGMSSASLCTLEVLGLEMKGADLLVNTSGSYRDPGTGNVGSGYYQVFRITPDKKIYRVAVAPGPSVGNGVNQRLILGAFGRILLRIDLSSSHACYKEWIGGNQFTPFLGNCEVPQTVYRIDDGMQGTEFNADSTSDYDIAFSASGDAYFKTIDPSRSYPSNGLFGKRDRMGRVWKIQTRPQTPANEAEFGRRAVNSDLAMPMRVASDGTIYFTTGGSDICVSRITPVGQLEAFLGRCDTAGNFQNLGINQPIPPGTPRSQISALDMRLASYFLNSRDEFYFDSASQGRGGFGIFKVGLDGLVYPEILQTTDNSKVSNSDGASLTQIQHPIRFLAFASDRHLFLYNGSSIFETLDPLPGFNAADLTVLEEEGQEAHRLSPFGRHLATRDLFLGIDLLSLNYSSEGRLSNIVDVNGRTLRIVRDSSGIPSQIIAPNGEATQLVLNAAGLLSSVSLPGGRQYAFTYASGGLITRFQNPRGLASTYTFETDGRLRTASKADGGSQTFARTEAETGIRVQRTSPTGRVSLYDTLPGNVKVLTSPTGEVTRIENNAGQISQIFANGSSTLQLFNGDPRNLGGAQVPAGSVAKLPGGQVRSESLSTVYSGLSAINPEDFTNYSISSSVNGRTENTSFDKAARTWNFASAAGRNAQSVLTPKGQVSSTTPHTGLIAASAQTFDSLGRLTSSVQGNLSASYSYDALDRVTAAQNAAGEVSRFEYDAASRVTAMVSPEGKRTLFTYDANNNVTSVKLPSGSTHTQGYSVTDLHTAYASPGATQDLGKSYNLEQELTRLTLSGTGRVFDVTRDAGGHVVGSAAAESSQVFTYADATGRVVKATNTQGSNSQVSQFTYNGPLVTAFSTSGAANSVFTYTFDNDFWVSNIVFDNGTVNLPIVRDGDGLMTQYGDFTLDRSGPLGAPVSISQGNGQWQKSYDNLGRLQTEALKVSGNVKLQFDYAYNTAGRLVSRTETDSTGNVRTVLFTYDRDGQLLGVSENGVSTEANVYDVNGNRTSRKVGANTRAATYDAKDRLIAQGGVNYVFDADGFVRTRGADTFTYGTRGELLSANVGGVAVSYVYDTQARLVARIQGSNKIEYLYGNLGEPFQLTAVKDAGVLTYHHYDPSGRLMAFDRGGVRYFVQTDQVGTPRVITDAAGNVVKQIRTSAFGEVLSDSAPAFKMYVGYAGGISDSLTGFVRFGFRDFEPLSGRWTARDPILFQGGQGNLYVYVGNGPVIQRDPDGLYFVPAIGAAVGGTLAGLDSYNHGDSPGTIAKKVAVGAVAGAIGTLPIPGLGAIAAGFATGAAAGFGQNLANQAIDKNAAGCGDSPLDFGTAGISGLVGGAAGALGSAAGYTRTPGTSGGTKPLFPEYRGSGQGNRDGINSAGNVLGGVSGSIGDYFAHKYFP